MSYRPQSFNGRQVRRMQAKAQRAAARSSKPAPRQRPVGPVHVATVRARIEADVQRLMTAAGLHCHIGDDPHQLANLFGRVVYIVCHAARAHGLHETPEARILAGSANALADVVQTPAQLDQHRASITSGMAAAQRLLPRLDTWALVDGATELDELLAQGDLGTGAVRRLVGMEG